MTKIKLLNGAGIIGLLWLMFVFSSYAITNKPFEINQLVAIGQSLWQIFLALLICSLAGGLGIAFFNQHFINLPSWSKASLTAALGIGVLSLFILIWGSTIGINASLFILPFLCIALLRKQILAWWHLWLQDIDLIKSNSNFSKIIISLISLLFFAQLFVALSPPLAFDSLTYHFYIPQVFIQFGMIKYLPDNMFWGMPKLIEMLYLPLILAGGVQTAAVFSWCLGFLTITGLVSFSNQHISRDSAWLTAGSLVVGQTQVNLLGSGYVEWGIMLFGLGIFIFLSRWKTSQTKSTLALAGLFAGLALSSKYTAGVGLVAALGVVFFFGSSIKSRLINLLVLGGSAALLLSPWLIKNSLATGNAFYPLLFATQDFDVLRMAFYNFLPQTQDWTRLILLPIQATILGVENREGFSASIGPLLLIFSPFAFLNWKDKTESERDLIKLAAIFLGSGFLVWAVASQFRGLLIQTRLYMVLFPVWALIAGFGFEQLKTLKIGSIRVGFIASVFTLLAILFRVYGSTSDVLRTGALAVPLGINSEEKYLTANTGNYLLAMNALKELPKDSKVLMLWETRGYYCAELCDSDEIIDRWYHDWHYYGSQIITAWKDAGYSHVLIYTRGERFVRQYDKNAPFVLDDWEALDHLKNKLTVLQTFDDDYILYDLQP